MHLLQKIVLTKSKISAIIVVSNRRLAYFVYFEYWFLDWPQE